MRFTADEQAAMIEAMGEDVIVGSDTIKGVYQSPAEVMDSFGNLIATNPAVVLTAADVAAQSIVGGESGTEITIDGIDYVVLSIIQGNGGLYTASLEEQT